MIKVARLEISISIYSIQPVLFDFITDEQQNILQHTNTFKAELQDDFVSLLYFE